MKKLTQRETDSVLAYEAILNPIVANRQCPDHPKYTGKRRPNRLCAGCWEIYLANVYLEGVNTNTEDINEDL